MNRSITTRLVKLVSLAILLILVIMPFHEFLTTWAASNFGHLDAWRIWKEALIGLCLPMAAYLVWANPKLIHWLKTSWLFWLIIAYIVLNLAIGVWAYKTGRVNKNALADGLLTDLRFPIFFIVTLTIASYSDLIKKYWQPILLVPAILVILFGLAQLLLPLNFLSHFGYGANTIPAYSLVDQNSHYRRIQSTLRGANPLGVYLILVIPAFFIRLRDKFYYRLAMIVLAVAAMLFTYSRSAYLGLIVTFVGLYYLLWLTDKLRRKFLIGCVILVLLLAGLIIGLRYNQVASNIFFHTNNSSKAPQSSNAQHVSAFETGIKEVYRQPLGDGPGTAGPASVHNNHPARIAENYYIQIAQETGLIGLAIFIVINAFVAKGLWQNRSDPLAALLLASFIGISLTNLLEHAWADDSISLIWWGLAGTALAPAIIKRERKSV
jgi:hypothetical protein